MICDLLESIYSFFYIYTSSISSFLAAFFVYFLVLFLAKLFHLRCYVKFSFKSLLKEVWKNKSRLYSPDYCTASIFKSLSGHDFELFKRNYYQTIFIKVWNKYNIIISGVWYLLIGIFFYLELILDFLFWFSSVRFFSRCSEISIAFYKDVVSKPKNKMSERNTFLTKYDRIRLATVSYVEIYILSASLYFTLDPSRPYAWLNSVYDSLSVGTFTNVGTALNCIGSEVYVFTQILTTLVLVIMSLAVYVGRSK